MRSLVGVFLPVTTVWRSKSGDKKWFDAAKEFMMLNRLLVMPGLEPTMLIIVVNLYLIVLRPRGSMVLQGSRTMNASGTL